MSARVSLPRFITLLKNWSPLSSVRAAFDDYWEPGAQMFQFVFSHIWNSWGKLHNGLFLLAKTFIFLCLFILQPCLLLFFFNVVLGKGRACHATFNYSLNPLKAEQQQIICHAVGKADWHARLLLMLLTEFGYFVPFLPQWPGFQVDRTTNGVWSPFLIRGNCITCFSLPLEEMYTWKRGSLC